LVFESGDFERLLYQNVIQWVKVAFTNREKNRWLPFWVRFEEQSNGDGELWSCREETLPEERVWTSDPIGADELIMPEGRFVSTKSHTNVESM
jgi:hypothetical protein